MKDEISKIKFENQNSEETFEAFDQINSNKEIGNLDMVKNQHSEIQIPGILISLLPCSMGMITPLDRPDMAPSSHVTTGLATGNSLQQHALLMPFTRYIIK